MTNDKNWMDVVVVAGFAQREIFQIRFAPRAQGVGVHRRLFRKFDVQECFVCVFARNHW